MPPNTACTGRGYRPKIRGAICQVWRDNVQESCQVRPAGNAIRWAVPCKNLVATHEKQNS
jgi:hypothetical protein